MFASPAGSLRWKAPLVFDPTPTRHICLCVHLSRRWWKLEGTGFTSKSDWGKQKNWTIIAGACGCNRCPSQVTWALYFFSQSPSAFTGGGTWTSRTSRLRAWCRCDRIIFPLLMSSYLADLFLFVIAVAKCRVCSIPTCLSCFSPPPCSPASIARWSWVGCVFYRSQYVAYNMLHSRPRQVIFIDCYFASSRGLVLHFSQSDLFVLHVFVWGFVQHNPSHCGRCKQY